MPISNDPQADIEIGQILAAAAHDLRQPVHSLNLLLAALAERAEGAETASLINSAQISADGVSGVIEAMLGLAAIRAGAAPADMAEFDIAGLLDHCRDQYTRQAVNKGIELRIVPCALRVRSDRILLQRLLDNLISNSIRHSNKGRVLVGCRRRGGKLRIGVLDNGPGLDAQTLADNSRASQSEWRGYALGVSIARAICSTIGHDMSVSSEAGRGAAVWVEVGVAGARDEVRKPSSPAAESAPVTDTVIALVEDDPEVYFATSELLIGWGYKVVGGASLGEAIDACLANENGRRPDLLLSDFKLPNAETAFDVIAGFYRHFGVEIPAIVVSGDPSAALDVAADGPAYEILRKPIRAAKLRALVRYALENAG